MSDVFSRLEDLSNRLNSTSDDLNETIKRVETKLASLRLGVEAWLPEPLTTERELPEYPDSPLVKARLGYAKASSTWCLAIFWDMGQPPDEHTITPLLQVQRDMRIRALHKIPALLSELERCAKASLDAVEDAKKAVATII